MASWGRNLSLGWEIFMWMRRFIWPNFIRKNWEETYVQFSGIYYRIPFEKFYRFPLIWGERRFPIMWMSMVVAADLKDSCPSMGKPENHATVVPLLKK